MHLTLQVMFRISAYVSLDKSGFNSSIIIYEYDTGIKTTFIDGHTGIYPKHISRAANNIECYLFCYAAIKNVIDIVLREDRLRQWSYLKMADSAIPQRN